MSYFYFRSFDCLRCSIPLIKKQCFLPLGLEPDFYDIGSWTVVKLQFMLVSIENTALVFFLKNRPLFHLFSSFQTHYKFYNKCVYEKCIRCWDSNSRPLEHEPPPITTKPGLLPERNACLIYLNEVLNRFGTRCVLLESVSSWSSLVEGDEQLDRANSQTTLELCHACITYFFGFNINTTAFCLGWSSLHLLLLLKSSMVSLIR